MSRIIKVNVGNVPGIQGQKGDTGDSGQPSNRYAFVLDTTASLNPPYFPRVSASFNGEDLAVAYVTTLGTGSATPYKIISELTPASQSVNIDRAALESNGVFLSRINDKTIIPKKYTAILTQTGTSDPTATVFENTLGGNVVWTRTNTGQYSGTLVGAFPVGKTICNCSINRGYTFISGPNITYTYHLFAQPNTDTIDITLGVLTYSGLNLSSTTVTDLGAGTYTRIQIEVFS